MDYSGGFELPMAPQRFGQWFVNRVANPKDILLYHRRRTPMAPMPKSGAKHVANESDERERFASMTGQNGTNGGMEPCTMANLVQECLASLNISDDTEADNAPKRRGLKTGAPECVGLLPDNAMREAIRLFVEKDDKEAIDKYETNV